jgi:hypothetical protein
MKIKFDWVSLQYGMVSEAIDDWCKRRTLMRINWLRLPAWMGWMSFGLYRCVTCKKRFWGRWIHDYCSEECCASDVSFIDLRNMAPACPTVPAVKGEVIECVKSSDDTGPPMEMIRIA